MPRNKRYANEDPVVAKRRIARNKAEDRSLDGDSPLDKVKTKADMMADNISSTIKNMGGGY